MTASTHRTLLALLALLLVGASTAEAQGILDRARRAAQRGAERAVERQVEDRSRRAVEGAVDAAFDAGATVVRCTFSDTACIEDARSRGENVVLVDAEGTPVDRTGAPVEADNAEAAIVRAGAVGATNANYDFVPGDRVLFADDFSRDNVGDFPRRLEFREGTMEIAAHAGGRVLSVKTRGAFDVVLPSALPDMFTLEVDVQVNELVNDFQIYPVDAEGRPAGTNYIQVDAYSGVGLGTFERGGVSAAQGDRRIIDQTLPLRVMVDGRYVKVFVGEERVANVPNADLGRTNRLRFDMIDIRDTPLYLADLRLAAGGLDLYGALESEGRVEAEGILFDTGSATLKPESFAVIQEVAAMLQDHPELRVRIEGHTDAEGDPASNQALSEARANAVRTMLVGLGVDAGRLEAAGLGQTQPVADNGTAEGREQNRRVELVRL